jgi:hypothetical protein
MTMAASVEERFSKLAAKVSGMNTGGVSTVPGEGPQIDMAHATAGIVGAPYYLIRVKYAGDLSSLPKLRVRVRSAVALMAAAKGWNSSDEQLQALCEVAMLEFIEDPVCRVCKGMRADYKGDACKRCDGTGVRHWPVLRIIRALDISYGEWRKRWRTRHRDIMSLMGQWVNVACITYLENTRREW